MRGEVLGVERRRRWGDELKLAIVKPVVIDSTTVTQAAVARQQFYARRHELKRNGLWSPDAGALFLPDRIVTAAKPSLVEDRLPVVPSVVRLDLRHSKDLVLRFECNIHDAAR